MQEPSLSNFRSAMVERQIAGRGVRDAGVLAAMREIPREEFLPPELREFAYDDAPLPIEGQQTISQPYIVAVMVEALLLKGSEKVLEIGAGSGYGAAVLSRIAGEVYTVERIAQLAEKAAGVLRTLGYLNVHVRHGDGTGGWAEQRPYDAIVVTAGAPNVPDALKSQLKIGGRLVIPVGKTPGLQELLRVTRLAADEYRTEELLDVRFVPLVGAEGWAAGEAAEQVAPRVRKDLSPDVALAKRIGQVGERFDDIDSVDLEPLMQRIGDARIVLIGEASHGTSEFYRLRERITRALIAWKGFSFVSIEGDWPDAARIDHYVRHLEYAPSEWTAFARFPTWMWRNREVGAFVDWLREYNGEQEAARRVAFYGLDLYSLYNSIRAVLDYLDDVDPEAARIARLRYGCLTPWQSDPATYGRAALSGSYRSCEEHVAHMLSDLMEKRHAYARHDGERFLDAVQNAKLVAGAEQYYRIMYYGSRASWNLRDTHMFETLKTLLDHHGPASKAIVWAHNSHIGNAAATEMGMRGEINIGQLCRDAFGDQAYSIGFGTDHGTVAAATDWDGEMEVKHVRPALAGSYERLCHESGAARFLLPLRGADADLIAGLMKPRLERAIGVIYRPQTELQSHYFEATLPRQFDEYVWFDETKAVTPLTTAELSGAAETYPFGL
ncbi:protein-L-isoaspartate(D-aspartate) O-methyltransferase [Parvibaculum sp.]|uniref:protein-L-isoaspartate(D-aspartate) O-methyltransferase n=1 Tax=Parvibaculum sp. TaxID=2024848 RepID=UPI00321167F7